MCVFQYYQQHPYILHSPAQRVLQTPGTGSTNTTDKVYFVHDKYTSTWNIKPCRKAINGNVNINRVLKCLNLDLKKNTFASKVYIFSRICWIVFIKKKERILNIARPASEKPPCFFPRISQFLYLLFN